MKKSLVFAAMVAVASVCESARAIDTTAGLSYQLSNLDYEGGEGSVTFTALGSSGPYCAYLMTWASPFNPNQVAICILHELRTPVYPSCGLNALADIPTSVVAGPAVDGVSYCESFDLLGILWPDISFQAAESASSPVIVGTATYPMAVPVIYAMEML